MSGTCGSSGLPGARRAVRGWRFPKPTIPTTRRWRCCCTTCCGARAATCSGCARSWSWPDPGIEPPPPPERAPEEAAGYLTHLLERWRDPLREVPREAYRKPVTQALTATNVEAMLEHAVMHPIRHSFQLRNLLAAQQAGQAPRVRQG